MKDCKEELKSPPQKKHALVQMVRQWVYQIADGYEDCNDADFLRIDPALMLAIGKDHKAAAGQSMLSRLENDVLDNAIGLEALDDTLSPGRKGLSRYRRHNFMLKKLHLGCGSKTPEGWLNLDGSWNAWLAKYPHIRKLLRYISIVPPQLLDIPVSPNIFVHDVSKSLPFSDNYFSCIYASHLLEHLYLEEGKNLLKECYRILVPNGVLRMVVPDLKTLILEYIEDVAISNDSIDTMNRADKLNRKLLFRCPQPPSGNIVYRIYTALKDLHSHKWMYDADSLITYFKWAGFIDVREMQLHHSRIDGIEQVEDPARVLNGAGVCVEGIKPSCINKTAYCLISV
jgi:SAM-dependent methyltransferase